jgi:hypothetical protein
MLLSRLVPFGQGDGELSADIDEDAVVEASMPDMGSKGKLAAFNLLLEQRRRQHDGMSP